jgi:hypothetical protein
VFGWGSCILLQQVFIETKVSKHYLQVVKSGLGEGVPVVGRGGLFGCEMSRLPHFLDSQLTDGGEVVSLTR